MATPTVEDKRIKGQIDQVRNYVISANKVLNRLMDDRDFRDTRYAQTPKLKNELHKLGSALGDAIVHSSNLTV